MNLNPGIPEKIPSLSLILPIYNEERIIRQNILQLADTLKTICADYEIIAVDDCSTDHSKDILNTLSAEVKELKVISSLVNQGLGGSLRKGFCAASKELVFYTDMDLPFECIQIYRAGQTLKTAGLDLITGVRNNRKREEPWVRVFSSYLYNLLMRAIFQTKIRDINFAFKLIKRPVLEKLNLKSCNSFIGAEMVIKAEYLDYHIGQIDIHYISRKDSSSRLFKSRIILLTLWEILKNLPEIKRLRRRNGQISDC